MHRAISQYKRTEGRNEFGLCHESLVFRQLADVLGGFVVEQLERVRVAKPLVALVPERLHCVGLHLHNCQRVVKSKKIANGFFLDSPSDWA